MSEPTNPLFEEEKAFLERKKLEYERALRGDVAQLKEQTAQVGRVAAVGAGLAGSIWLITKIFGGGKGRKKEEAEVEWPEVEWPTADKAGDYHGQRFADFDFADDDNEDEDARYNTSSHWRDTDPYFGSNAYEPAAHGTVYHSDTEDYDTPSAPGTASSTDAAADDDADDNGLGDYPDFPEHSSPQHSADTNSAPVADTAAADNFQSEAYGHPESSLAFDDSRRLPESKDFTDEPTADHADEPKRNLGSMLVALAKSDMGKVVLGQAASLAAALVTKAIKSKLAGDEPETAKSSDLAASTDSTDGPAHGYSATPQPDADPAPADDPARPE
jgi:hypothetical protein